MHQFYKMTIVSRVLAGALRAKSATDDTLALMTEGSLVGVAAGGPRANPTLPVLQQERTTSMTNLPTGTVTCLSTCTDVEGSTTRWEQQPQDMQTALARHDAILREAIAGLAQYTCPQFGKKVLGHGLIEIAHQEAKRDSMSPSAADAFLRSLMR